MDVSEKKNQSAQSAAESGTGQDLLDSVATLTGLPENMILEELQGLVAAAGRNPDQVTLDELRQAMLLYLDEVAAEESSSTIPSPQ